MRKVLLATAIGAAFTAATFGAAYAQQQGQPNAPIGHDPFAAGTNGGIRFNQAPYVYPRRLKVLQTDDFYLNVWGIVDVAVDIAPARKVDLNGAYAGNTTIIKMLSAGPSKTTSMIFESGYKVSPEVFVSFKLDMAIQFNTGDATSISNGAGTASGYTGAIWSRESWGAVSGPSWGGVKFGRVYNPLLGISAATAGFGQVAAGGEQDVQAYYQGRVNNAIMYITPPISGFWGEFMYGMGNLTLGNDYGSNYASRIGYYVPGQPWLVQIGVGAVSGGSKSTVNPANALTGLANNANTMWYSTGAAGANTLSGSFNAGLNSGLIAPGKTAVSSAFQLRYFFPSEGAINGAPSVSLNVASSAGYVKQNGYQFGGGAAQARTWITGNNMGANGTGITVANAPATTLTNYNTSNVRDVILSGAYPTGPHTFKGAIGWAKDESFFTNQAAAVTPAVGAVAASTGPVLNDVKPTSYKLGLGYQYNFNPAVDVYGDFGYVWNRSGAISTVTNGFLLSGGNSYAADVGFEWWW